MDTMRPLDGSGPSKPTLQQHEAGSAPVARVDALTDVEAQRNDSGADGAPALIAASLDANREVLESADSLAIELDSVEVADLRKQVSDGRYVLDAATLVDRMMADAGQLLPLRVPEE